jgi:hypothetical protein
LNYFFHSFPRSRRNESRHDQLTKGLQIASSLLKNGLLLTPENYTLPVIGDDGEVVDSIAATQRRACFTELSASELPGHSQLFGPFALAFPIDRLRQLGALPVFYIPTQVQGRYLSNLGLEILLGVTDASRIIATLSMVRAKLAESPDLQLKFRGKVIDYSIDESAAIRSFIDTLFESALADPTTTDSRLLAAASCFYPTENAQYTKQLAYYRQREWRIVHGSFTYDGNEPFTRATEAQAAELVAIDEDFFSKELSFADRKPGIGAAVRDTIGRRSYFYRTLADIDVVGSAEYFIVPDELEFPNSLKHGYQQRGITVIRQDEFVSSHSGA